MDGDPTRAVGVAAFTGAIGHGRNRSEALGHDAKGLPQQQHETGAVQQGDHQPNPLSGSFHHCLEWFRCSGTVASIQAQRLAQAAPKVRKASSRLDVDIAKTLVYKS
jgi:hypothetical protein